MSRAHSVFVLHIFFFRPRHNKNNFFFGGKRHAQKLPGTLHPCPLCMDYCTSSGTGAPCRIHNYIDNPLICKGPGSSYLVPFNVVSSSFSFMILNKVPEYLLPPMLPRGTVNAIPVPGTSICIRMISPGLICLHISSVTIEIQSIFSEASSPTHIPSLFAAQ